MIYDFKCERCNTKYEESISMNDYSKMVVGGVYLGKACPKCGGPLKRVLSSTSSISIIIPEYMQAGSEGDSYTKVHQMMKNSKGISGKKHFY